MRIATMDETIIDPRLLILIARTRAGMDDLITGLLDVGVTGATIIESRGLGSIVREDMPIFAGLAALIPQHTGSRVVLSLTTTSVIAAMRKFIYDMHPDERPIAIVLPVEQAFGGHFPEKQ
jgi:hypothetical protein